MTDYLCATCKHRKGKLRTYHRIDTCGIERSYTNVVKVCCTASAKYPNMVKDAVADKPWMDPQFVCIDYKRKGKA